MEFLQPVTVQVRDPDLNIIGVVTDYTSLQMIPRHNAVGAYVLEIGADSPQARHMITGNGLVIKRGEAVLMSGPMREPNWAQSGDSGGSGKLTVNGVDDTAILAGTTCWPAPTVGPDAQTNAAYKIDGISAEPAMWDLVDQNIGPNATAERQIPSLTMAPKGFRGSAISKQVNQFDNLLTVLAEIGNTSGLGFRVVQIGTSLQFQVYEPVDRRDSAKFSFGLGNLSDASYSVTYPTCTKAIVVAGGENSARIIKVYTRPDPAFPGPWLEQFVDKTGVDTTTADRDQQMDQAADEALTSGAAQANLSMTPIDTPRLQFGIDYSVGDIVSCQVRDSFLADVVREVNVSFDADGGYAAKAAIGSSDGTNNQDAIAVQMAYIRQIFKRLRRVETRQKA